MRNNIAKAVSAPIVSLPIWAKQSAGNLVFLQTNGVDRIELFIVFINIDFGD